MGPVTEPGDDKWDGHRRHSREYNRILWALACAGLVTFAQLYAPQGILPEISHDFGVTADQSALLISAGTIGLALGVLPWAWVADRVGRLPVMTASLVMATALGLAIALCPNLTVILVLRALQGLALGGLPALAIVYLQEEIHPAHAALAAGTYVSGTAVGGLLGRVVAAPVTSLADWRWGLGAVVALAAVATTAFILLTPPPRGFVALPKERRSSTLRLVWINLRTPAMLVLYSQGFLLMGGFVTIYNYLAFYLQHEPYSLPAAVTSMLFFAYLAGTWSSRRAGHAALRRGRLTVLLASIAVMVAGLGITLVPSLPAIVAGLVILTMGFFGAHSIASGWTAAQATAGRAQATSLYNLFYYAGSSVVGWLGGIVFTASGWNATALSVIGLCAMAAAFAAAGLRGDRGSS